MDALMPLGEGRMSYCSACCLARQITYISVWKEQNVNQPPTIKNGSNRASFEEALAETKFGKFNYFFIVIAGTILGTVLFETLGISYVLPVTDCDLNLNTQQKGILSAIGFVGIITSSHLWGFLADTKGRRRVIRPTLQISFCFTLISSFLNNFWLLVIFRFLNGFFVSGSSATIYAYLGEFHTDKARSKAIMGASVVFGLAALLMPAFAWLVINQTFEFYIPLLNVTYTSWRLFIVVCGMPGLICALCLYVIPESPKYILLHKGPDEALAILKKVYKINTGHEGNTFAFTCIDKNEEFTVDGEATNTSTNPVINTFKSMWRQTNPLFQGTFIRQTLLGCLLQFITYLTANGMYMWFPDILDQIGAFRTAYPTSSSSICQIVEANKIQSPNVNQTISPTDVIGCRKTLDITAYQSSLFLEVLYVISFAVIGAIVNAAGKVSILLVIMAGTGASCIALVYVTDPLLCIFLFIVVMLCGLSTVVINAAMVDLFPTSLRAMAICITMMMGRCGSVVGANVVGVLLDYNCQAAFWFSGATLIAGGFLGFFLPKTIQGKNQPTTKTELDEASVKSESMLDS